MHYATLALRYTLDRLYAACYVTCVYFYLPALALALAHHCGYVGGSL